MMVLGMYFDMTLGVLLARLYAFKNVVPFHLFPCLCIAFLILHEGVRCVAQYTFIDATIMMDAINTMRFKSHTVMSSRHKCSNVTCSRMLSPVSFENKMLVLSRPVPLHSLRDRVPYMLP